MIIKAVLAASVLFAAAVPACADPAEKPRFKHSGERCTAQEVANPPVVGSIWLGGREVAVTETCLTRSEWNLARAEEQDQKLKTSAFNRRSNTLNAGYGFSSLP